MDQPLLFLIKLAWACRYRLPLLITVGFMALDIRMQLEIHVQMRRIRRGGPPLPLRGGRSAPNAPQNSPRNRNNSDDSNSSWVTVDEDNAVREEVANLDETANEENTPSTSQEMEEGEMIDNYLNLPEISDFSLMHNNLLDVNLEN